MIDIDFHYTPIDSPALHPPDLPRTRNDFAARETFTADNARKAPKSLNSSTWVGE